VERDAGQREVSAPQRKFLEGVTPARRPCRKVDLGDDLVGLERRRQRACKNFGPLMMRAPAVPTAVISAPQATATPGSSAAGSA
jgi:hypothetical protein